MICVDECIDSIAVGLTANQRGRVDPGFIVSSPTSRLTVMDAEAAVLAVHRRRWPSCSASELAMRATTVAVQLFGGYGSTKDFPVERMMRDAKISEIGEGTSEIQRIVIARHLLRELSS